MLGAPVEEGPDAIADMSVDGTIGRVQGSGTEVRRPAAEEAVESVSHVRPRARRARSQQAADLAFDPRKGNGAVGQPSTPPRRSSTLQCGAIAVSIF